MASPPSSSASLSMISDSRHASPVPSPPSTAPSTPNGDSRITLFVIAHVISASFLKSLPVCTSSGDRVLFFAGTGPARDLFVQAAEVLQDENAFAPGKWESAQAVEGDCLAVYWRTRTDEAALVRSQACESFDINSITVDSREYAQRDAFNLFTDAGFRAIISLPSATSNLTLHILERPAFTFPRLSQIPATSINPTANPFTIPSPSCFRDLWSAWDLVTLGMIPSSMLHQKPIDLRHKPLFYIGHLPTFNALLLTDLLHVSMVEPRHYASIFERGIDPHVDDPEHCHNHSEVPEKDEDWPLLEQVLSFRDRVRELIMKTLDELERGERVLTRRMARTLMMMHEHEGWHMETILYMLIQRAGTGTRPPPGFTIPPWSLLFKQWDSIPPPSTLTVTLGPCSIVIGHDDAESDDLLPEHELDVAGHEFGWDNESPKKIVKVGKFRVEWRPITNGEFMAFWEQSKDIVALPPSWVEEHGKLKVRTLYGPVPFEYAKHWPCLTAYDDLRAYADWKGGRIPTEHELRLFLDTYQVGYDEGANVGFRNWHPLPATTGITSEGGKGSNGGVWEWSSTVLEGHVGFEGTSIFPGYSADFFDTKHQVVLGASHATIPHLSQRHTIRNFYQHNYPYPWVGARVAYNI